MIRTGRVEATPTTSRMRLRTAFGEVHWSNARFLLEVTTSHSTLTVHEGAAEWRDARGVQQVSAGSVLEAPPAMVEVPASLLVAPVTTECEGADRGACLQLRARGDSLDAETALFELALTERSVSLTSSLTHLREYERRFPQGVFIAEARTIAIVELAQLGRREEARAEASRFERDLPDDTLLPVVRSVAAQLQE